ncbi:sensor histidine kinase [Paractinoplanes atraurantiacus]|uniref:histidine kinase n=1 Tax=Paractinoplanes atraurantiacus TaxID=1036182 RepID=A0A285KFT1_9ACTN|nr:histidine kinase [Actinoplanes atraurantiacus]SNY71465.1 Signal transduction histidine kinase [Actinoplanes atraurantiacus]
MRSEDAGATAGLLRVGQRLRRFDTRRPWALDTALVLLLFLNFCLPDLGGVRHEDGPVAFSDLPAGEMVVLQLALLVPLWWRRRAPMAVFHVVMLVFIAQCLSGVLLRADAAVGIAFYSLVRYGRLDRLIWAAPVLLASFGPVTWRLSDRMGVSDVLFFLASVFTAAGALAIAVRLRQANVAALRDRAERLEVEREQRDRLATATERTRVAREVHDIVGHSLSVIVSLADAGAYAVGTAPERSREALQLIGDTGRKSLAELRRTVGVLRDDEGAPDLRPQPGLADLDELCERIRAAGPGIEYRTAGDFTHLDRGVQVTAFRIVQEALTNTLRYAGSHTTVTLAVTAGHDRLHIEVRDSGPPGGSAANDTGNPAREGHGLAGMRERAAIYGGTVDAGPVPGGGWHVTADLDAVRLEEHA